MQVANNEHNSSPLWHFSGSGTVHKFHDLLTYLHGSGVTHCLIS